MFQQFLLPLARQQYRVLTSGPNLVPKCNVKCFSSAALGKLISIRIGAACRPVETVVRQAAVAAGLFRHQTRSSCCWCKTIMKINCFLLLSAVQPGCTAQHLFSSVRTVTVIVHPPRAAPDQRGAPVTEIIVLVPVSTLPPRPGPPPTSATAALPPSGGGAGKVAAPTARISPATARGYRCLI